MSDKWTMPEWMRAVIVDEHGNITHGHPHEAIAEMEGRCYAEYMEWRAGNRARPSDATVYFGALVDVVQNRHDGNETGVAEAQRILDDLPPPPSLP